MLKKTNLIDTLFENIHQWVSQGELNPLSFRGQDLVNLNEKYGTGFAYSYLASVLPNSCEYNTLGELNNSGYVPRVERIDYGIYSLE